MRNPIKSYFAPFRAKIAEAEAAGCGVEFLEFYVLLPAWLCYETVYVVQVYQNLLVKTAGLDWPILVQFFITTAWLSLIYTGRMLLLWQHLSMRSLSWRFEIAMWLTLIFDVTRNVWLFYYGSVVMTADQATIYLGKIDGIFLLFICNYYFGKIKYRKRRRSGAR